MKVIVFGVTGMVGQVSFASASPTRGSRAYSRWGGRATGQQHPKLREIVLPDLADSSAVAAQPSGYGIARAMLQVARHGAPKAVLETADINAVAAAAS